MEKSKTKSKRDWEGVVFAEMSNKQVGWLIWFFILFLMFHIFIC